MENKTEHNKQTPGWTTRIEKNVRTLNLYDKTKDVIKFISEAPPENKHDVVLLSNVWDKLHFERLNRQQWHKRLFQGFIENWNKGVNEIGAKAWGKAIFLHDPSVGVQSFLDPSWVIGIHKMGGLNQEIKDFLHDLWLPTLQRAKENKDMIEQFPGERGDTFELDMISLVFSAAIINHDIIMSNDDIGTLAELLVDYKNLDIPENKNNDDQFRVFETWFRRVILEREMNHDNISGAADKATTVVDKATTARVPKM